MDHEGFKIYVDRLHDGKVESIKESFPPAFLEQESEDLAYNANVDISGETYIAENELIIHLNIHTQATVPCKMCNNPVKVPVDLEGVYFVESLDHAKSGIYFFKDALRECILLEAPSLAECNGGHCPSREEVSKFLSSDSPNEKTDNEDEGYHPFANLTL